MRFLWYAGVRFAFRRAMSWGLQLTMTKASTALAAGVVAYAFNQRANFYSAAVYLSQNNLSLMVSGGGRPAQPRLELEADDE